MANKLASILSAGNNQYPTPAISLNRWATDMVSAGIIGALTNTAGVAPATGALAVNAQGSPNMTVAVNGGVAYLAATPTGGTAQVLGITQDVSENVTISSNSSGSTVYDFVYMKADPDKMNNPASNGLDVLTLVTSRSTTAYSAGTPSTFGNSNGAQANTLLLAVVTVVNLAASIGNSAITDARVQALDTLPSGVGTVSNAALAANTAWTAWTPTVTGATGTFTTATGAGRYQQIGKTVIYQASCTITTIGTGTGCVFTLPVTCQASANEVIGTAREDATSGKMGVAKLASSTAGTVIDYANGNIVSGGSGSIVRVYGTYEAA